MVGTVAVLSDKLIVNATGFGRTVLESFIKRAGKLSKPVDLFFLSSLSCRATKIVYTYEKRKVLYVRGKTLAEVFQVKSTRGNATFYNFLTIVEKWFLNEFNFSGNGYIDTLLFVG